MQALDPAVGEGDKTKASKTEMVKNLFSGLIKKGGQIRGVTEDEIDFRRHPLYPCVTLMLLQEVLNRRLFSTVRYEPRKRADQPNETGWLASGRAGGRALATWSSVC